MRQPTFEWVATIDPSWGQVKQLVAYKGDIVMITDRNYVLLLQENFETGQFRVRPMAFEMAPMPEPI